MNISPPLSTTDFKIGIKHDNGKLPWHLLPWRPIEMIVEVLQFGKIKYTEDGWKSVEDAERRYYSAMMRHIVADKEGEPFDPESGLPHLAHAACSLVFLMWFKIKNGGFRRERTSV